MKKYEKIQKNSKKFKKIQKNSKKSRNHYFSVCINFISVNSFTVRLSKSTKKLKKKYLDRFQKCATTGLSKNIVLFVSLQIS